MPLQWYAPVSSDNVWSCVGYCHWCPSFLSCFLKEWGWNSSPHAFYDLYFCVCVTDSDSSLTCCLCCFRTTVYHCHACLKMPIFKFIHSLAGTFYSLKKTKRKAQDAWTKWIPELTKSAPSALHTITILTVMWRSFNQCITCSTHLWAFSRTANRSFSCWRHRSISDSD